MNYTIKCPCGEWDYIANVYVKQFYLPSFRVDGAVIDSLVVRSDASWSYVVSGEDGNYRIDSLPMNSHEIIYYETDGEKTNVKQTKYVWLPYYRYFVNQQGKVELMRCGNNIANGVYIVKIASKEGIITKPVLIVSR